MSDSETVADLNNDTNFSTNSSYLYGSRQLLEDLSASIPIVVFIGGH